MLPTSTAITASCGVTLAQLREDAAGCMRPAPSRSVARARLLRTPPGPLLLDRRPLRPASRLGTAARRNARACGRCRPTRARRRDGTCRASSGRSRPGWSVRTWRCRCGPKTTRPAPAGSRCGPCGCGTDRDAGTAEDAARQRVVVGHEAFGLERCVMIGASICSANAMISRRNRGPRCRQMITGRSALREERDRALQLGLGWARCPGRPPDRSWDRGRGSGSARRRAPAPRRGR